MELEVVLDFKCCHCRHPLGATLKCAGKGLAAPGDPVAAVNIPCPTCNSINKVCFHRSGEIARVLPYRQPWGILTPSLN